MLSLKFKQGFMIVGMCACATSSAIGAIVNTVTVKGTGPDEVVDGITASAIEEVDVVDANESLQITKTGEITDSNSNGVADVGEVITYTFKVKNIGKVTIKDVSVSDDTTNATGAPVVPNNPILFEDVGTYVDGVLVAETTEDSTDSVSTDAIWDVLAPNDTVSFTGVYTVIQSDLDPIN